MSRRGRTVRGVLLAIAAFCILPLNDAIAKFLVEQHTVPQLVWARLFFQSLVVTVWLSTTGQLTLSLGKKPGLVLIAVGAVWLANYPFFVALRYMGLADAFALVITAPLAVIVLCAVFLKEQVRYYHWLMVVVGFLGALVIVRPGHGVFQWAAVLPLLSAGLFAVYQVTIRKLTGTLAAPQLLFLTSVPPMLGACMLLPWFWVTPEPMAWVLMAAMGMGAGFAHFLLIKSFELAPASLIAPFMYVQLLSSTLIGLLMFGDLPDAVTALGASLIVGAGLCGLWLARRG
jgi:drug/metabolite transporter (DMT)-like permease